VGGELQGFKLRKTSGPAEVDKGATLREGLVAEKAANERLRAVDMERWYTELEQRETRHSSLLHTCWAPANHWRCE
jgi:hypothetical protein